MHLLTIKKLLKKKKNINMFSFYPLFPQLNLYIVTLNKIDYPNGFNKDLKL